MYLVTPAFLAALRGSHAITTQVDVYSGTGTLLSSNLPVEAGVVTIDASSDVRRQLDLTVADAALAPAPGDTTALLAPYGNELYVRRGIVFPDASVEWVPLGYFRIEKATQTLGSEGVKVTGVDRSRRVAQALFQQPTNSDTARTIPSMIAKLVQDAGRSYPFDDLSGTATMTPTLFWENDRWGAASDLAASIGCEVFFGPTGRLVVRPVPSINNDPVWAVDSGEHGVMVSADRETSRETTYNIVIAAAEPVDGLPPLQYVARDNDPASPTYYLGGFGQVPYSFTSPSITSVAQAQTAALARLDRTRGLSRSVSLSAVPNPALDAGDVITVAFPDGTVERHLVDSLTISLDPGSAMPIKTRSTDPTKE